jgi:large subunit ribosomal protein L18
MRRRERNRRKLRAKTGDRVRLSVFRSNKYIYAQLIDDNQGRTLASASSLEKDVRSKLSSACNKSAAAEVGKLIAERAKEAGIENVIFDRGGYIYHGRVQALADAAREAGLKF